MDIKKLCYIVVLTTILFTQEEILTFIPSIQLTFFLIILYGAVLGIKYASLIVLIHVLLDNLYMSSFTIFTIGPMLIGYFICLAGGYLLRNKNEYIIAVFSGICALIYSALFIPINTFVYHVDVIAYMISDIPFVLTMVSCNVISVIFLYKPMYKLLNKEINKNELIETI